MRSLLCVILILIACILGGCGESIEDVAGVYETKEVKTPITGNNHWHKSSKWILDLSEGGSFTLTNEVFRVPTQDKKYSPIPEKGLSEKGEWMLHGGNLSIMIEPFVPPEVNGTRDRPYLAKIPFEIQSNGSMVAGRYDASGVNATVGEFSPDLYLLKPFSGIWGIRFERSE
jgi:hypothetical protein